MARKTRKVSKRQGAYKPKGAVNVRWSKLGTTRQFGKK